MEYSISIEFNILNLIKLYFLAMQVNTIEDFIPQTSIFDVITSEKKLNTWTGIPTFALLGVIC